MPRRNRNARSASKNQKHFSIPEVPPSREPLTPLNAKQLRYIKAIQSSDTIIGLGPAGTGKTFIPTILGADWLLNREIERIIITRPVVDVDGQSLGYFPGSLQDKFGHWVVPVIEALEKRMGNNLVRNYLYNGKIEIAPLNTMRGRTFDNALVMLDEAQNTSGVQMKMLLTRIGENTKVVLTGDIGQTDVKGLNGLTQAIDIARTYDLPVPIIEFSEDDVVRSKVCKLWVEAYSKYEKR